MTDLHAVICIAIISLVTILLRFIPFLIFNGKRKTPPVITYLSTKLPYAIMGMLVIYCLKDISFSGVSTFVPQLIASGIVAGSYVRKKNTLLSIVLGTAAYMVMIQCIFC